MSGFALTWNNPQASFTVPSFRYFCHNHSHIAAAKRWVGLFFGSLEMQVASCWGNNITSSLAFCSSAQVAGFGSCTRLKYLSGMLTCIMGHTTALNIKLNVCGSVIFLRDEMFAGTKLAWVCALDRWLEVDIIIWHTSSLHFSSRRDLRNSQPLGTSVAGSTTSTPPTDSASWRCKHAGSHIILMTQSISASVICNQ